MCCLLVSNNDKQSSKVDFVLAERVHYQAGDEAGQFVREKRGNTRTNAYVFDQHSGLSPVGRSFNLETFALEAR